MNFLILDLLLGLGLFLCGFAAARRGWHGLSLLCVIFAAFCGVVVMVTAAVILLNETLQ